MTRDQFIVQKQETGMRLDLFLTQRFNGVSRSRVQRMIAEGSVLLNQVSGTKKQSITEGDIIEIVEQIPMTAPQNPVAQNIPLEILYEDEFLLAVNKPAGLVVHPGNGVPNGTLVNALLFRGSNLSDGFSKERPGIVHRLDKDTSGVLLVAKNNRIHTKLAAAFAERTITKQYLGICVGMPRPEQGSIEQALDRSRREPIKRTVSSEGKPATTLYETVAYKSGIAIILFSPRTGRTHQIRVHCSFAGFPVLADPLYGGGKDRLLRIDPVERPFAFTLYKCFSRHALHAYRITFTHPQTNLPITVQAPLPDDFQRALLSFGQPDLKTHIEKQSKQKVQILLPDN